MSSTGTNTGRQGTVLDTLGLNKFNLDSLHHELRRNVTKVDPRLSEDLKNIALLIKEEKNILSTLQNLASERKEVSKHLFVWGKEDNGEDVADITEKLANLFGKIADAEVVFCEKYERYRSLLKEIREAEQRLHVPKERRRKVNDEISRLVKSHPTSPRIKDLQGDLQRINTDATIDELDVGNITRQKLKEAYALQLTTMFETAEKIAIISGFAWELLEHINTTPAKVGEPRSRYEGFKATQEIVKECQVALHRWQPLSTGIRELLPALTNTAPSQLATQKQEYETKISQLNAQIAETSKSLADLKQSSEAQKANYEKKISELSTNTATQKEGYEAQIADLSESLTQQKHGYEVQLNDLAAALAAQREESQVVTGGLSAEIDSLKQQSEAQKQQSETQKQQSEAQIKELSTSLNAEREKYEAQLKENGTLISQTKDLEMTVREKDAHISKLQSEMNTVATEKEKLSQLVKDLEETIKNNSTTLNQKEEKVSRLEDDISSIKSQLAGLKLTPSSPVASGAAPASNRSTTTASASGAAPPPASPTPSATLNVASPPVEQSPMISPAPVQLQQPPLVGPQYGYYDPNRQQLDQQYYQQQLYQQQQYYAQGQQAPYGYQPPPQQDYTQGAPPAGYTQGAPPAGSSQAGGFVGGFFLGQPDEAPPAYDGPPKEGFSSDDKKSKS